MRFDDLPLLCGGELMRFPNKAYILISEESKTDKNKIDSILAFACVVCGENGSWLITMYRTHNQKPYTRKMCLGRDHCCFSEKGKWMTHKESQKIQDIYWGE